MSDEETIEHRQDEEFEVLQSIYLDNVKDLRTKKPWNKWTPLELSLLLTPPTGSSGGGEVDTQVELLIYCSDKYPNVPPCISFENSKGISNQVLNKFKKELEEKARALCGEVMIHELAQAVRVFLDEHKKPASKSCYEEMQLKKHQREQDEQERQRLESDKKKQTLLYEIQEIQEIQKMEPKRLREQRLSTETSSGESLEAEASCNRRNNSSEVSDESFTCHQSIETIEFCSTVVQRGSCINHDKPNRIIYSGMSTENGKLYNIVEWTIDFKSLDSIQKQILNIEKEFNYLVTLKHPNLLHYLGFNYKIVEAENKVIVHILQEFVIGINIKHLYLLNNVPIEMEMLRYVAEKLLSALDFLHKSNVIHRDVSSSVVNISRTGIVHLADYSLDARLSDLTSDVIACHSKKTDIYKFGLLILSLLRGSDGVVDECELPNGICKELQDFLEKTLNKEENHRHSASQLLNHPFIKVPLIKVCPNGNGEQKLHDEQLCALPDLQNNEVEESHIKMLVHLDMNGESRAEKEFNRLGFLGKGGFGSVYKVQNKLDQRVYALKRITLNPKNKQLNKKIIREVKLLSRLNHENVVRYYYSWIETGISRDDSSCSDDDDDWMGIETLSDDDDDDEDDDDDDDEFVQFERSKIEDEPVDLVDMYIQMEFCEKSTLRTAIDDNLYLDDNRVWRLFRETIEGLSHIHLQGMIHRDLKPMNIFLDHKDHVKIGDFGLATTNLLTKPNELFSTNKSYNDYCSNDGGGDSSMTGHIGTALYTAPELTSTTKAVYNEKVDIYSLGVIFFEMCFKPIATAMERDKVLTNLRSDTIILPSEFQNKNSNREYIIRWLLDHNDSKRPTAQELLQSDKLPPPVWEESKLQMQLTKTLSNSQLKSYKYLIEACFKQPVKRAQDITYDKDISVQNLTKNLHVYNKTKTLISKVFEIHGGQNLVTPLLMPKSKYYEGTDTCVKLMTHSGSIVSVPHDLRVPFARYVAWNGITSLRRYSIERVYREKKVFGFIPRELYECAFDIVTSTPGNLMDDAEILHILNEIMNNVPQFKNKNLRLKLNHTKLLKAIFLNIGIKDDKHNDLFCLLSDVRDFKNKKESLLIQLLNKGLSDSIIQILFRYLEMEEIPISKLEQTMNFITKSEALKFSKQAIKELKAIVQNAYSFGIELEIFIAPGLVHNIQQYSGMICQLVCDIKKKNRQGIDVIAVGGRYDGLVENFRKMLVQADMSKDIVQSAVGVSISLDRLVSGMEKGDLCQQTLDSLDVVICSLGNNNMVKEKCNVLKSLWSARVRCCVINANNLDALQHQCQELNVQHSVILKDADVKIISWEKESGRMQEKRISHTDVVEVLHKILKSSAESNSEQPYVYNALNRSESRVSHSDNSQEPNVVIKYIEKPPTNTRRKSDNQIYTQLSHVFKKIVGDVVCYPVKLDGTLIKLIAAHLDWDSENGLKKSVDGIKERTQKHKNTIETICEKIYDSKKSKCNPVVILYSLSDTTYKVLM